MLCYYHYTRLTAIFPGQPGKAGITKVKTSLDLNETRDYGVLERCGISWTMCKQSAPRSRQTTTPAGGMLFLTRDQQCQSNEGKLLTHIG